MEPKERETKQRMSAAQSFLLNIDSWLKSQAGTKIAAIVAPFIENISRFVTEFAIGKQNTTLPRCEKSYPDMPQITTSAPRVMKKVEKTCPALPQKLQLSVFPWVKFAMKAKLPNLPTNLVKPRYATQIKSTRQEPPKENE